MERREKRKPTTICLEVHSYRNTGGQPDGERGVLGRGVIRGMLGGDVPLAW